MVGVLYRSNINDRHSSMLGQDGSFCLQLDFVSDSICNKITPQ